MFENDFENGIDFQALLENPVFVENCSPANLKRYREGVCDRIRMYDDLQFDGSEVLCVSWEGVDLPWGREAGCARILEWNGFFFIDAADCGEAGPYRTFGEADHYLCLENEVLGSISIRCRELTDEQLTTRALELVRDREVVVLNNVWFIKRKDTLAKATKEEIEAASVASDPDE